MLKSLALITLAILLVTPSAFAKYQWGFANVSLNYLDWDSATEKKSTKEDFAYVELEGGGQFSWGELYGFFDLENLGYASDEMRAAGKGSIRYYLGRSNFSIYTHVYNFSEKGFSEQNRVLGLGYQFTTPTAWVKPFLGVHDVTQTYFSGLNGYMGGWVIGYGFRVADQSFLFTSWHELEFARKEAYAAGNGGKRLSHNGAAAIWWNALAQITIGAQWRYATDKLGTAGRMNAGIATIKYNF